MYKSEGLSGDKLAVSLKSTQILNEPEHGTKELQGIFAWEQCRSTSLCLRQCTPTKKRNP